MTRWVLVLVAGCAPDPGASTPTPDVGTVPVGTPVATPPPDLSPSCETGCAGHDLTDPYPGALAADAAGGAWFGVREGSATVHLATVDAQGLELGGVLPAYDIEVLHRRGEGWLVGVKGPSGDLFGTPMSADEAVVAFDSDGVVEWWIDVDGAATGPSMAPTASGGVVVLAESARLYDSVGTLLVDRTGLIETAGVLAHFDADGTLVSFDHLGLPAHDRASVATSDAGAVAWFGRTDDPLPGGVEVPSEDGFRGYLAASEPTGATRVLPVHTAHEARLRSLVRVESEWWFLLDVWAPGFQNLGEPPDDWAVQLGETVWPLPHLGSNAQTTALVRVDADLEPLDVVVPRVVENTCPMNGDVQQQISVNTRIHDLAPIPGGAAVVGAVNASCFDGVVTLPHQAGSTDYLGLERPASGGFVAVLDPAGTVRWVRVHQPIAGETDGRVAGDATTLFVATAWDAWGAVPAGQGLLQLARP